MTRLVRTVPFANPTRMRARSQDVAPPRLTVDLAPQLRVLRAHRKNRSASQTVLSDRVRVAGSRSRGVCSRRRAPRRPTAFDALHRRIFRDEREPAAEGVRDDHPVTELRSLSIEKDALAWGDGTRAALAPP